MIGTTSTAANSSAGERRLVCHMAIDRGSAGDAGAVAAAHAANQNGSIHPMSVGEPVW